MNTCDKPCAIAGLTSYRYRGNYGWVMIGASDIFDALKEAERSVREKAHTSRLQVWTIAGYQTVPENALQAV
jgi:hypothetical protein